MTPALHPRRDDTDFRHRIPSYTLARCYEDGARGGEGVGAVFHRHTERESLERRRKRAVACVNNRIGRFLPVAMFPDSLVMPDVQLLTVKCKTVVTYLTKSLYLPLSVAHSLS